MLTVSVKVVLLASRMGSLAQVEFTKGDVVSQCDVYLLLQPAALYEIQHTQFSKTKLFAVWIPYGQGSSAHCWCHSC